MQRSHCLQPRYLVVLSVWIAACGTGSSSNDSGSDTSIPFDNPPADIQVLTDRTDTHETALVQDTITMQDTIDLVDTVEPTDIAIDSIDIANEPTDVVTDDVVDVFTQDLPDTIEVAPDSGPVCTPEAVFNGPPIAATTGSWTWVDVPGARCRNGSGTGFGVRLQPSSDRLLILFEGGGLCFNAVTCAGNPSSFASGNFSQWAIALGNRGILDDANTANPFRGWNVVYIPYCTGDMHAGNATPVNVPGTGAPTNQSFVGYANLGLFLQRIIPTFTNVSQVFVTGVDFGGLGALWNYHRLAQDFCPRSVALLDDSAPILSDTYFSPCLQTRFRTLWGLNNTLPVNCTACSGPNGGGLVNYHTYLKEQYPMAEIGILSSTRDGTMAQFYGYGANNCANIDGFAAALSGATYTQALNELRSSYLQTLGSPWSSYFVNATTHSYLTSPGFYNTTAGNTPLTDWVSGLVTNAPSSHVGP